MEGLLGALFIIFLLLFLLGPLLSRYVVPWLQRWALGKMEDRIRRMAGMPTRKQEKKARRRASGQRRQSGERHGERHGEPSAVDYMRSYAEDAEWEEIK